MLRITIVFGVLTGLLWLADRLDTPDTVSAIKPLLWGCAIAWAALLVRLAVELLAGRRAERGRTSGTEGV